MSSEQTAQATACSQPSPFLNTSGPSLARVDDIHSPYQRSFCATVSWSEAATPKGPARSHWLLAGNTLGKLSKQSMDKHPWFSLSPSLRQNWTDSHHPHLLLKTFSVEDAGCLCGKQCSTGLSIKRTMSNLYYLPSANEITCLSDDFGDRAQISCMWRFTSSLTS